jgi:hypothetical protein
LATTYLDRAWIEQRLHYVDEERNYNIVESHDSYAIILSEAEHLLPLLLKALGPRIPRETEIWTISPFSYQREFLGSFTPKKFSNIPRDSGTTRQQGAAAHQVSPHQIASPSPPPSKRFKSSSTLINEEHKDEDSPSESESGS